MAGPDRKHITDALVARISELKGAEQEQFLNEILRHLPVHDLIAFYVWTFDKQPV